MEISFLPFLTFAEILDAKKQFKEKIKEQIRDKLS